MSERVDDLERRISNERRQIDQTLQWRPLLPADAIAQGRQRGEGQLQAAGALHDLARRTAAQAQALDQGGKA